MVSVTSRPGRIVVFLLGLLVVAAPAHAESGDGPDQSEEDSTASDDTSGNDTSGSQNASGPAPFVDSNSDRPCGLVYWHQSDPDRVIIDPNNCFVPIIYNLFTGM